MAIAYVRNRSTDFDEICHGDAYSASQADERPKVWEFQNPRLQTAAILKIEKSRYLHNHLAVFDEILYDDTY